MSRNELIIRALKVIVNQPYVQGFTEDDKELAERIIDEIHAEISLKEYYHKGG